MMRGQTVRPLNRGTNERIQRSSVVERSAVNRLVVGSNPTAGAILGIIVPEVNLCHFAAKPVRMNDVRGFFILPLNAKLGLSLTANA
jgi:hypothetical protein